MKTFLTALALASLAPVTAAVAAPNAAVSPQAADATVAVNGLVCDFCVQAITKTFRKRSEISGVTVDLTAKQIRLAFKPGKSLDDATLRKLVTDAGYAVTGIARRAA
jgi:copper chaperone CopZ